MWLGRRMGPFGEHSMNLQSLRQQTGPGQSLSGCGNCWLRRAATILDLFRYIAFRTGGAIVTAILVVFILGPSLIDALHARQGGPAHGEIGRSRHLLTRSAPTMDGLMILIELFVATILSARPTALCRSTCSP